MERAKKVKIKTLGCKLNQFESDAIALQLKSMGYEILQERDLRDEDIVIINTCTVTSKSDRKSRNLINQGKKNKNSILVVTGCYVNNEREKLERESGITFIVENKLKSQIPSLIDAHIKGEVYHPFNGRASVFDFLDLKEKISRTRANIKIQDGCDNLCSFCIIPFVRGRGISRDINDIVKNVEVLVESGFKEIVLTGVNMSRYSFEKYKFKDVLSKILNTKGNFRVRISSLEPERIDDIIELINHPKMTPHLHLCLQSASNKILLQMRRLYCFEDYQNIVKKIRKINNLFNITTDIIVGFPGESDEDFLDSCKTTKDLKFGHVHIFKYSKRKGTRAERLKEQLREDIKKERSEELSRISQNIKNEYRKAFLGKELIVLLENKSENYWKGYSEYYIPVRINYNDESLKMNSFVKVKIENSIYENGELILIGEKQGEFKYE